MGEKSSIYTLLEQIKINSLYWIVFVRISFSLFLGYWFKMQLPLTDWLRDWKLCALQNIYQIIMIKCDSILDQFPISFSQKFPINYCKSIFTNIHPIVFNNDKSIIFTFALGFFSYSTIFNYFQSKIILSIQ